MESLPEFKYHPDPISTGSVQTNEAAPCLGCSRARGYVYVGPAYSERFHYLSGNLCPWCIADGTAARRFGATFTDTGLLEGVEQNALEELEKRTPGFTAWQQEQWQVCCGDAAAFLGPAGWRDLEHQSQASAAVRKYVREQYELRGKDLDDFLSALKRDDSPTAYIFRCLHCRKYLAYVDEA
jgi:uncharacterized protein CbrC (UPF0167 family)